MSKFKVGDPVWEHGYGWGKIVSIDDDPTYSIESEHSTYTESGKRYDRDKLPSLLTVEEAREFRIPDPPREPVEGWVNVYPGRQRSGLHKTREEADYLGEDRIACVKVREVDE